MGIIGDISDVYRIRSYFFISDFYGEICSVKALPQSKALRNEVFKTIFIGSEVRNVAGHSTGQFEGSFLSHIEISGIAPFISGVFLNLLSRSRNRALSLNVDSTTRDLQNRGSERCSLIIGIFHQVVAVIGFAQGRFVGERSSLTRFGKGFCSPRNMLRGDLGERDNLGALQLR